MIKTKIVRDKIPSFFENEGKECHVEKLSDIWGLRWRELLAAKVREEAGELADAIENEDFPNILEEYGDTLDVLDLVKTQVVASDAQIEQERVRKAERAGGFVKGYVITYEKA